MQGDFVVRDPRGIAGMVFHLDNRTFSMQEAHTYLLSCGFEQRESAQYMKKLLEDSEKLDGVQVLRNRYQQ